MFSPLLIHVPHASVKIPSDCLSEFLIADLESELLKMTDRFCDEIFAAEAEMIVFPVSRLVCDPERFRDDQEEEMAEKGMGAVYTRCSDGSVLRQTDAVRREEILSAFYDPHHRRLSEAVRRRLESFGKCLIVDGHSFSSVPLAHEADGSPNRPDICIGTDPFHTSADLAEYAGAWFENKGYRVCFNRPFSGTIVPLFCYRREKRVQSVMIEINRALYMDGAGNRKSFMEPLKADIGGFLKETEERFLLG